MRIIGLCGVKGSGKSTLAEALRSRGWYVESFAAPLKSAMMEAFLFTGDQVYGAAKDDVDPFYGVTPRTIMQQFGTDFAQQVLGKGVWCRVARRRLNALEAMGERAVVFDDVRFPHEAEAIRRWGGTVYRLSRGLDDARGEGAHASERAVLDVVPDFEIENEGRSVGETVRDLVGHLEG